MSSSILAAKFDFHLIKGRQPKTVELLIARNLGPDYDAPEFIAGAMIDGRTAQLAFQPIDASRAPISNAEPMGESMLVADVSSAPVFRNAEMVAVTLDAAFTWLTMNELARWQEPSLDSENDTLVLRASSATPTGASGVRSDTKSSKGPTTPRRRKQSVKVWI